VPTAKLSLKGGGDPTDAAFVNVVLVPALLLLVGLVLYKKVLEPRRAASGEPGASKGADKAAKKAAKARASSGSGRMGSVL